MTTREELERLPPFDVEAPEEYMRLMVYLAAPYVHEDSSIVIDRVRKCNAAAKYLVSLGIPAFSPCTYTSQWTGQALNNGFMPPQSWLAFDSAFLINSDVLVIYMLPGVENSVGVAFELAMAREIGIPIFRLEERYLPECNEAVTR